VFVVLKVLCAEPVKDEALFASSSRPGVFSDATNASSRGGDTLSVENPSARFACVLVPVSRESHLLPAT
jgi:hypothetical protein